MSERHEPIVQTRARPKGEKRRSNLSLWLFVGVVLIALVTVPFLLLRPRADIYTLRSYETATVQRGPLVDYVRSTGTVTPRLERSVLAPVEGSLSEWLVAEGDEVLEGASLGRFSSNSLADDLADALKDVQAAQLGLEKLALTQTSAARTASLELERAQLELSQAQIELNTVRKLFSAGASSQNEVSAADLKVNQLSKDVASKIAAQQEAMAANDLATREANLQLEQAGAKLASVQEKQAGLELSAPVTGRVMKLDLTPGASAQIGALLATVASSEDVRVVTKVPESQAGRVSVGQVATLKVGTADYPGTVVQVSPNAESGQNGAVVAVTLSFDTPPQDIRIGASATANIEVDRKEDALYLPRAAFLSTGGERFVYLLDANTATRTNVTFGLVDGNNVEVREGLTEGDRIVSSSYEAFKDKVDIELITEGEIN